MDPAVEILVYVLTGWIITILACMCCIYVIPDVISRCCITYRNNAVSDDCTESVRERCLRLVTVETLGEEPDTNVEFAIEAYVHCVTGIPVRPCINSDTSVQNEYRPVVPIIVATLMCSHNEM
jgi:hypothetical protein